VDNLPPPISPNDRPLLHKIGEYIFQDLTVDLMASEDDLKLARLYGKRGESQFGVDAIADCVGGGTALAQSKCYKEIDESGVTKACDEFYKNLPRWRKYDPRRFLLVVACDATSNKVVDEIEKQRRRFKKEGIEFETWDRIIIIQKLQLRRNLVHRYLGSSSTWVSILCGPQQERAASASSSTSEAERQLLQSMLLPHVEGELRRLREVLRRGKRAEVCADLRSFRDNPQKWAVLDAKTPPATFKRPSSTSMRLGC
jgi:hypothetical protein